MKIIAHRGGSASTPENTLAAFANAVAIGADMIELDIHLSADGIPMVIHDATLDRTTNGTGPVNGRTVEELQLLDAGMGERIPRLEEVFELVGDRVPFALELKSVEAVEPTIALLGNYPQIRWMVLSGIPAAQDALRTAVPDADLAFSCFGSREGAQALLDLLEREHRVVSSLFMERLRRDAESFDLESVLARADELRAKKVGVYYQGVTQELVDRVHARGFEIGAWTVNDPAAAQKLLDLGVDTLTTDDPKTMLELAKSAV